MNIICKRKGQGKTTDLIKLSNQTKGVIVVKDGRLCDYTMGLAMKLHLPIPEPITYREFLRNEYRGYSIPSFLIDDLELFLEYISHVKVQAVTVTTQQMDISLITDSRLATNHDIQS